MGSLIWAKTALSEFTKAIYFIEENNPTTSVRVRNKILDELEKIQKNHKRHIFDKYKIENNKKYRVLYVYNFMISYKSVEDDIHIVRFRHMKRNPRNF